MAWEGHPVNLLIDAVRGCRPTGNSGKEWIALCPAHDDHEKSLTFGIGDKQPVVLECKAGCSFNAVCQAIGVDPQILMAPRDGRERPFGASRNGKQAGKALTRAELAADKQIPEEFLDTVGVRDLPNGLGVGIPYDREDRTRIWMKRRTALVAKKGSKWGEKIPVASYGIWRLPKAREVGYLVLVEGETDCWTLWLHGFPCLGIPGATATDALKQEEIRGFSKIYVWREPTDTPGKSGDAFVRGIGLRLREFGWTGDAREIRLDGCKDPNDLHKRNPELFKAEFQRILDTAPPLTDPDKIPKPPKESGGRKKKPAIIPGMVGDLPNDPPGIEPVIPGFYGLSDHGNAKRFVYRHGKNVRWCRGWKQWLAWEGGRWVSDAEDPIMERAKETVISIYAEAARAEDETLRANLGRHAASSESARALFDLVRLARSETGVRVDFRQLDKENWLLNCPNGTVDLKTGELLQHNPENLMTTMCPTAYDPKAECPKWEDFLTEVFCNDADLIGYVQRLLGYCLTGDTRKHLLAVFWGKGSNGKGTLLNTLYDVLGDDYASASMSDLLMEKRGERHPVEIADLFGKRLVTCQETADNQQLNESLVKWLTGGDVLSARRMRENLWRFKPTHKIILSTNYRPKITGTDKGIWRRIRLIPFKATFEGDSEKPDMKFRLLEESTGILAWCIRGCLEWQRQKEKPPEAVTVATEEYRSDEDMVERFIREMTHVQSDGRVQASTLYGSFRDWSEKGGERRIPNQKRFGMRMTDMGYGRDKSNGVWYTGISLVGAPETKQEKNGDHSEGQSFEGLERFDESFDPIGS